MVKKNTWNDSNGLKINGSKRANKFPSEEVAVYPAVLFLISFPYHRGDRKQSSPALNLELSQGISIWQSLIFFCSVPPLPLLSTVTIETHNPQRPSAPTLSKWAAGEGKALVAFFQCSASIRYDLSWPQSIFSNKKDEKILLSSPLKPCQIWDRHQKPACLLH